MGLILVLTRPNFLFENKLVYNILNIIVNILRSIPFIILFFFILPFTKLIVGTVIGVTGVIVHLVIYTAPFIARQMETALLEAEPGVIEAYHETGIKRRSNTWKVIPREERPAIIVDAP